MNDTIFALATPPGRSALALMRISGPRCAEVLNALGAGSLEVRKAGLRTLRTQGGEVIDQALCVRFEGPASFTGEDVAELSIHGGSAVVEALTQALSALGLRPAEPGEFTRRAFENGRLDLAQAEGIADLIDAESEAQRLQALEQLGGRLSERHGLWRQSLLRILALFEAEIDFPDEDVPDHVSRQTRAEIEALRASLAAALDDGRAGERIRDGYRIALIGAPNAGKSTLFNALVGRDAAIVTPLAGTTRDIIEASVDLAGYKVTFADTAGLRETADVIEAEGVSRARRWAQDAALRLWVRDPREVEDEEARALFREGDIIVLTRADLLDTPIRSGKGLWVSGATGEGIDALREHLEERVRADLSASEFPAITRARHRVSLGEAHAHLGDALAQMDHPELAGESVRLAGRALARVTGSLGVEDVLGEVFSTFCIGK
ncbi:MAG: tRNA uridine-5-carboxymethylaminomethyl(34) synthesis GTPase MnmE [Brevundimonas sp.]|uniref:tRNA uridine-5-carboxymethylaminomethyl(34) synthesis GTPase MnmE n=1 Tax=Brevundimonas sp. TaxID=1871086 RepID=UPI00391CA095